MLNLHYARLYFATLFSFLYDNTTMDAIAQTLPTTNVAALQAQIRDYVALLALCKKKRDELKTHNTTLKGLGDDIMHNMLEQHIPSCASMGYTFSVKEKAKMKSATAKSFMTQVQNYFNISDDVMSEFMTNMDSKRKAEAEVVSTLECKSAKRNANQDGEASETSGDNSSAPTLSSTIDDMYS